MVAGADPTADRPGEPVGVVVGDPVSGIDLGAEHEAGQRRGPADPARDAGGVHHPGDVVGMTQVGRVDPRRVRGIGGPQPQRPARPGRQELDGQPEDRPAGDGLVVVGPGGEHLQIRRPLGVGTSGPHREHHLERRAPTAGGDRQVHRDQGVVDEVGADAGQVRLDRQAERPEVRRGPDPAAQQDRRAGVGAAGEDHRVGLDDATVLQTHATCPAVLHLDPVDRRVGADVEVGPRPGRRQVGQGRAHPDAVVHVARPRSDADRSRPVVVVAPGVPAGDSGGGERLHALVELVRAQAHDRDRAVPAVPLVREVLIGLHAAEEGQQFVERPPRVARRGPPVVVTGPTAHPDRTVRRGTAADQARAGQRHRCADPVGLGHEVPVVAQRGTGPVGDVSGQVGDGGVVRTGLDQHDGAPAARAQPCSEHAPRRPGTHDDDGTGHGTHLISARAGRATARTACSPRSAGSEAPTVHEPAPPARER